MATFLREPSRNGTYNRGRFYPWFPGDKAPTLAALGPKHDNHAAIKRGDGWRQLEWQEAARLQGFPADYVFVGSQTQVWKQISQAVQIDTARAILSELCARLASAQE